MATTPRLGLYKPVGGDFVDPVAAIANQMNAIDSQIFTTICTSGTRPGSPFSGMEIYETDTDKLYFWTGAIWQFISDGFASPPSSGGLTRGHQIFTIGNWATTLDVEPGQEAGPPFSTQLNLLKGRKYAFHCGFNVRNVDANQTLKATLRLRGGEAASVTTASPLIYQGTADYFGSSTGFNVSHEFSCPYDAPGVGTAQFTFGMFLFSPSGRNVGGIDFSTGDTTYQYLAIEDIGGL